MFSVLLKNLCASIYHLLSVDVCVLAHFFDTLVNMSANACRLTKTMDSAISPKSCQELGSLQDLAGHLLLMRLLASVFLVSCCTAVPTKISGFVLMDRMRLPNKSTTCMAVILASCCINLSAKEMTKMILNSSSYICSHLRWVGLKIFEAL